LQTKVLRLFPRHPEFRFRGEELKAAAQLAFLYEVGMKVFSIDAVDVVTVAKRGDSDAFAERPADPVETTASPVETNFSRSCSSLLE
jgi:hypothetical protein